MSDFEEYEFGYWRRYGEEHGTKPKPLSTAKNQADAYAKNLERLQQLRANGLRDEPAEPAKHDVSPSTVLVCPEGCGMVVEPFDLDVTDDFGNAVKRTMAYCPKCLHDWPLEVVQQNQP